MHFLRFFIVVIAFTTSAVAQTLTRIDTFQVSSNGTILKNAWAGGLNFAQLSVIDMNMDGKKDLFIFDRSGNKVNTYINQGITDSISYIHKPQYTAAFPAMHDWALLVDYNCDGKEDIFTYSVGGMAVYKNTSTTQLSFTKITNLVYSNYNPNNLNLYVSPADIPAITDVDGDGDIDVLTFGVSGTSCEFHKNLSKETYGHCDSLTFSMVESCWGDFTENFANNGVTLNASCKYRYAPLPSFGKNHKTLHTGSTLLAFDNDCDGDKELLLGDISFSNMNFLTNGGNATTAHVTAQDATFPTNNTPVNVYIFPAGFQLDVDNDGLKDLVIGANAANASQDYNSLWLYDNTGSNCSPNYKFHKQALLQDEMVDLGEGAYPVFFDYDNDGLKDIVVGNYGYFISAGNYRSSLALYKNTGSLSVPKFTLITFDMANTSAMNKANMYPTFGDLDNDGDKDMIVGDYDGKIHYYQNTAGTVNPANFVLNQSNIPNSSGNVIDVGQYAAPQLVDVNKDGLLDLIIGTRSGNLYYYQNIGTAGSYVFKIMSNTFGGVDVRQSGYITGYSTPCLLDDNGVSRLFVGCERGFIFYYNNIDGNLTGTFNKVDSTFADIKEGVRTSLNISKITNTSDYYWVVGNYGGGISMYKSGGNLAVFNTLVGNETFSFELFPNPNAGSFNITLKGSNHISGAGLEILTILGEKVYTQQLNNSNSNIDLSHLSGGMYIVKVKMNEEIHTKKLILKK